MCGIAGIYDFGGRSVPTRIELRRMIEQLRHRGPDGDGFYLDGGLGLAHARLSIIDLAGGAQPIRNETGSVWVVFNGEIFNYIELRRDLEQRGHRFYTSSDTEVLVHLYEEEGEAFVHRLNGQFAIALWDQDARKLLLVRDRPGILPLYYTVRNGRLLFGSEVKALLPVLGESPSLDPAGLDQLMSFWSTVGEQTVFKDIRQVTPGQMLLVTPHGLERRAYWDWTFPIQPEAYRNGPPESQAEELHDLLVDATRIRLRSDVPVGAYLSGGLDSSILVSIIQRFGRAKLRTFSIGFSDADLDESTFQQEMVARLRTDHSAVRCSHAEIADRFPDTVWASESPMLRTAPVPMGMLSGLAHGADYRVVLTGEGADEVFGGYDLFKEAKIRRFWSRYPQSRLRPLLLKRLYPYLDLSRQQTLTYLQSFFGLGLDRPDSPFFSHLPRWETTSRSKEFLVPDFRHDGERRAREALMQTLPGQFGSWHPFHQAQYLEAKTLMTGYLLASQGDRMLMANSVEGRFPYLDHRVIEFANSLHPNVKMRVLKEKYLLKLAFGRYLPSRILARHKQPYRAPDIAAFYGERTPEFVGEMLSPGLLRRYGYFDPDKVHRLIAKIRAGRTIGFKDNMAFVAILSTQIWHHLFVEKLSENLGKRADWSAPPIHQAVAGN